MTGDGSPTRAQKLRRMIAKRRAKTDKAAGVPPARTLETLEDRARRSVTIATLNNSDNFARSNKQTQSPLFGLIPGEIRELIFFWALTQHETKHEFREYPKSLMNSKHHNILSLLLTCRLAWLEGNHIPMETATLTLSGFYSSAEFSGFFDRLSYNNAYALNHVKLTSTPSHLLEALAEPTTAEAFLGSQNFCPKKLSFTLTHGENAVNLTSHDFTWVKTLLNMTGALYLDDFSIELHIKSNKRLEGMALNHALVTLESYTGSSHVVDHQTWQLCLDGMLRLSSGMGKKGARMERLVWSPCRMADAMPEIGEILDLDVGDEDTIMQDAGVEVEGAPVGADTVVKLPLRIRRESRRRGKTARGRSTNTSALGAASLRQSVSARWCLLGSLLEFVVE